MGTKVIPPASPEGGDRRIVLETVFKVDKRELEAGGGGPYLSDKSAPPPKQGGRERAGEREAKDHLETASRGKGGTIFARQKSSSPQQGGQTS